MTPEQLRAIARLPANMAAVAAKPLNAAMERFDINTPQRQAHFVPQAVHESGGFTKMTENLNYASKALLAIWPNRFTPETARLYGRVDVALPGQKPHAANQQMIANVAYANRMGNGSIESGDGWRYRGRGPGMLTGLDNYRKCGKALGIDLVNFPEQVAQLEVGCLAFAWFWKTNGLNELADIGAVDRISGRVNGGDLGLKERRDLTEDALEILMKGVLA